MNEPATVRVAHVEGRPPRQAALYWLALGTFAIGKRPHRADDPRIVEETRQYLRDFERMAERAPIGTATVRTDACPAPPPREPRHVVVVSARS